MNTIARLWRQMRTVLGSSRFDRELDEEMRQHLERRVQDAIDAGVDEAEARRAAARRFGGTLQVREASRDVWGLTWLADLGQDLRYGARLLRRNPGFAATAILSLALGIGANTAVFSLLDALVLRPLPVRVPHELMLVGEPTTIGLGHGTQRGLRTIYTFGEYRDLVARQQVFTGLAAVSEAPGESNVRVDQEFAEVERATGTLVSGNYFEVLGVGALLGRVLTAADDTAPGAHPVTVISEDYWSRRFSRDAGALGRTIRIGRTALVIVGIAAKGFSGDHVGRRTDFWIPLSMQPEAMLHRAWLDDPYALWLRLIGRLRAGETAAHASAGLNVTLQQILMEKAGTLPTAEERQKLLNQRIGLTSAATGVSRVRGQFSGSLAVIMGMVALVLLLACTNLATLMLARITARQKELGMRLALGAGRSRIVRQLLAESVLLTALGALASLVVARVSGQVLLRMASSGSDPIPLAIPLDGRVLGFVAAVALAAALIVGLVPALRASRSDPIVALRASSTDGANGRRRLSGRRVLVVAQVAATLVLLVGAGLLVATLRNLGRADVGFARDLLQIEVDAVGAGYEEARLLQLGRRLVTRLGGIGGVASVSLADSGLLTGSDSMAPITVLGERTVSDQERTTRFDRVSDGFFSTASVPVVAGREFTERDGPGAPVVAVVNESMARFYFGERPAVGRQFVMETRDGHPTPITIVGVVTDVRELGLRTGVVRRFYLPYLQPAHEPVSLQLLIRASGSVAVVGPAVRAAIREVDPSLEIVTMLTIGERLDRMNVRDRLTARLATAFGVLAMLLTATGLYGILAYAVRRRAKELGIRMALGAGRAEIARLVLGDAARMVLAGAGVGLPAALLGARALSSQLFGLSFFEPWNIAAAVLVLLLVATCAAYLPARHAMRVDPLVALKSE